MRLHRTNKHFIIVYRFRWILMAHSCTHANTNIYCFRCSVFFRNGDCTIDDITLFLILLHCLINSQMDPILCDSLDITSNSQSYYNDVPHFFSRHFICFDHISEQFQHVAMCLLQIKSNVCIFNKQSKRIHGLNWCIFFCVFKFSNIDLTRFSAIIRNGHEESWNSCKDFSQ